MVLHLYWFVSHKNSTKSFGRNNVEWKKNSTNRRIKSIKRLHQCILKNTDADFSLLLSLHLFLIHNDIIELQLDYRVLLIWHIKVSLYKLTGYIKVHFLIHLVKRKCTTVTPWFFSPDYITNYIIVIVGTNQ